MKNMKNKDCPFWLKIAIKLPLSWKHYIREQIQMAEYWSEKMVLLDSTSLLLLIEGTNNPNFVEFDKRLDIAKKEWGKHDSFLESLAVRKRLLEFKKYHKVTNNEKT